MDKNKYDKKATKYIIVNDNKITEHGHDYVRNIRVNFVISW